MNNTFNSNTGDLVTQYEQSKKTDMMQGFREIGYTAVEDIQQQQQITPRQVRTGQTRGDQYLRGLQITEQRNSRQVVVIGQSDKNIF